MRTTQSASNHIQPVRNQRLFLVIQIRRYQRKHRDLLLQPPILLYRQIKRVPQVRIVLLINPLSQSAKPDSSSAQANVGARTAASSNPQNGSTAANTAANSSGATTSASAQVSTGAQANVAVASSAMASVAAARPM